MRQQLIEALTYPRVLIRQLIDEGNYQHQNFFEATGQRCHACDGEACGWDKCLGDFRGFEDKSIEELSESLREGIRLVEGTISELRHDETKCMCETCTWIRNAEHLREECEHHLPHVEPNLHQQPAAE